MERRREMDTSSPSDANPRAEQQTQIGQNSSPEKLDNQASTPNHHGQEPHPEAATWRSRLRRMLPVPQPASLPQPIFEAPPVQSPRQLPFKQFFSEARWNQRLPTLFNSESTIFPQSKRNSTGSGQISEKYPAPSDNNVVVSEAYVDDDSCSDSIQFGVKQAEAVAAAWSRKPLTIAYVGVFLVFFVNSLQQQMASSLNPYVTSAFAKHSLLSTISVVSSLVGAIMKLPVSKIIDIWGRTEGYILMVTFCVLGMIMMATSNSIEAFAAAQVFYWVGNNGIAYVLDVFLADTSSLKNRGWLLAFSNSPFIATTFAGPALAQAFLKSYGWRWAFGTFSVVIPLASLPMVVIFIRSSNKAIEMGYLKNRRSDRTLWQTVIHYTIEFDVFGMVLIIAGLTLLLLPINLATYQAEKWKSPAMILMAAIGGCCLPAFFIWEYRFAKVHFAPFHLLTDRTVLGGCLLSATLFCSFYIIRVTGRFKPFALAAVPFQALGIGLMILYRKPGSNIASVIICQCIIAVSAGTLQICEQIAVMAAASHSEVAIVLALLGLFSNIGGAIGQTVTGAIWSHTIPEQLAILLPDSAKDQAAAIYASLTTQLGHPVGTPIRNAIIAAYGEGQRWMLVTGVGVLSLALASVIMWRNIELKNIHQVQGTIV
ncbi:siderophore iron transporter [Microsporum canis CBS 113480]|uniref:Siderophore iron transporter n=1 Tax=Arthroderma otae (strain ATCC MYA-4605 / CBS 113480) TaxID=554155 RepID=C5FD47_ARTOC|nr:siderophore iron transporter [Microsporum canis CBS 113480]EEQ27731.1 siderophore iron transporter [Microsporum canis CBS 113480]